MEPIASSYTDFTKTVFDVKGLEVVTLVTAELDMWAKFTSEKKTLKPHMKRKACTKSDTELQKKQFVLATDER